LGSFGTDSDHAVVRFLALVEDLDVVASRYEEPGLETDQDVAVAHIQVVSGTGADHGIKRSSRVVT